MTQQIPNNMLAFDGGPFVLRNKLLNGNFDIWQRGTTNTSTDTFGFLADRWGRGVTGSSISQSRQLFTVGQTAVPNNPAAYWEGVVTSSAGASNYAYLYQAIENVRTLSGQSAVLTFWAKADAARNMAVEFFQLFGTGGSPSSTVYGIGVTTCALTTSWQKFTVSVTVPSVSGKTLGSNNDDRFAVVFWFDAGSSFNTRTNSLGQQSGTFSIAQVQLEQGTAATSFEQRPPSVEVPMCQRYFRNGRGVFLATNAWTPVWWGIPMRAAPNVVITPDSGTGGTVNVMADGMYQSANHSVSVGYSYSASADL